MFLISEHQGLDLDLCAQTTYDQIQRSQAPDPYQDVYNMIQGDEEIQLEKPWRNGKRLHWVCFKTLTLQCVIPTLSWSFVHSLQLYI